MTDEALALLAAWGTPALFFVTLASCLALPVPASMMMLSAGAFAASGDLSASTVGLAALAGAISGDQVGYWLARLGRGRFPPGQAAGKRGALIKKAALLMHSHGGYGVFLSRWLFSPLGPYANLAAGAAGMRWGRFTAWGALGEAVWVGLYVGLGLAFARNLSIAVDVAANLIGILSGALVSLGLAWWLRRALRKARRRRTVRG